ncbi:MAG: hypothetical protein WKF73_15170 [Nocardioidaceae bacterium]
MARSGQRQLDRLRFQQPSTLRVHCGHEVNDAPLLAEGADRYWNLRHFLLLQVC